jgi:hypothetical protein
MMQAKRFERIWSNGLYRVLDTETNRYATNGFPRADKEFVGYLADMFNAGNKGVLMQYQLGNTDHLQGLADSLYCDTSQPEFPRKVGERGIL